MRRVILLLAAVLALVPAAGASLCVAESGRVAIELVGDACASPVDGAGCMRACDGCEDTPLSVGAAHRAKTHVDPIAGDVPSDLPGPAANLTRVPAPDRTRSTFSFRSRTPLLRC